MKAKRIFIVALAVFGLSLHSCDDRLEITQPGEIAADLIYQDLGTLQNALNAVYGAYPYLNTVDFTSVWTDEVRLGLTNGGQGITDGSWAYVLNDQSGSAASLWNSHHRMINFANRVIRGENLVPTTSEQEEEVLRDIIAQARFMRALAYIQAVAYFSTSLSDLNALSIIVFEDVPQATEMRPRGTVGETYALIEADLAYAEANLLSRTGANALRLANVRACKAIRARMAIYREQYALALQLSQELIDEVPLSPRAQFGAMWTDANNNERIFFIARQVGDPTYAGIWSNVGPGVGNNNWFEMGRGLFERFENTDIRKFAFAGLGGQQGQTPSDPQFVLPPASPIISLISADPDNDPNFRENDQLCIYKYPGKFNQPYLADHKVFRVAEFHLIKAEALAGLGQLTEAAAAVKFLRDARHSSAQPTPNYATAQAAFLDILNERRLELCYEAMRYIDVKRLGVRAGNATFSRFFRDCGLNNSCNAPSPTDPRFTMPIPNNEMNANRNMVQNPGY